MSVMTMTTIGFGDHAPKTRVGRAVACIWVPLSVLTAIEFVACLCKVFFQYSTNVEKANKLKMLKRMSSGGFDLLERMKKDDSGRITRDEFMCFMLKETLAVDVELFDDLNELFDSFAGGPKSQFTTIDQAARRSRDTTASDLA